MYGAVGQDDGFTEPSLYKSWEKLLMTMQVGLGKYQQEMVTSIENKKAFQHAAKFYRAMGLAPVTTCLDAIEWSKTFSSTPIRNALRQLTKDQATAHRAGDLDERIDVSFHGRSLIFGQLPEGISNGS